MSMFNWRTYLNRIARRCRRLVKSGAKTPRQTARLRLEPLEERCTPSATQFVTQVYTDLLGRPVDAGGLSFFTGQLNQGVSPTEVVLEIESSSEYQSDVV